MDQSSEVANPARGQLNRECIFPCFCTRLRIWSRETGSAITSRVSLLISILRLNLVLTYGIPPEFRGGVHLFILDHHTPLGSSRVYGVTQLRANGVHCRESGGTRPVVLKVVPATGPAILQVTMDQIMCASLFPHVLLVRSGHVDRVGNTDHGGMRANLHRRSALVEAVVEDE